MVLKIESWNGNIVKIFVSLSRGIDQEEIIQILSFSCLLVGR
jgi:hypothetical protein